MENDLNIKGALLSWCGVFGGALTLFSNLQTVKVFADWANYISIKWIEIIEIFWSKLFIYFDVNFHPSVRYQMTMALLMVMMASGAYFSNAYSKSSEKWEISLKNIFRWNILLAVIIFLSGYFLHIPFSKIYLYFYPTLSWNIFTILFYLIYGISIYIGTYHWPIKARLIATVSAIIISLIFQEAASTVQGNDNEADTISIVTGSAVTIFLAITTLLIAPPMQFAKRLFLVIICFCILIGLNEVSKMDINLLAPKRVVTIL